MKTQGQLLTYLGLHSRRPPPHMLVVQPMPRA
jgi:hypothetical protein